MKVEVRELTAADCHMSESRIAELLSQFDDQERDVWRYFNETISAVNVRIHAALHQNEIIGFYVGTIKPAFLSKTFYIDCVVVARDYRGKGVGKALMEFAQRYVEQMQLDCIDLTSSRQAAQALYKTLGFETNTQAFRWKPE